MSEHLFRVFGRNCENGETVFDVMRYPVVKRTPKGCWIEISKYHQKPKFVLNDARKRYAYPTLDEAMKSFVIRKKRQIVILRNALERAEREYEVAQLGLERASIHIDSDWFSTYFFNGQTSPIQFSCPPWVAA